jgi:hypothetical protein
MAWAACPVPDAASHPKANQARSGHGIHKIAITINFKKSTAKRDGLVLFYMRVRYCRGDAKNATRQIRKDNGSLFLLPARRGGAGVKFPNSGI